ncbi:uncharacterized protein LOC113389548 [Ctenocephalides felis]|uniref:uncharacterized protein LOC113389544 n=1 Tax=Ctenocephalides felis TaxID=7515 RepID=UPI000E6E4BF2|nr:uncharacterized protein LOC113389544 [Ctenocephalides felis]XP_026482355.1 uncharacterized protein LOC113389548 [Ctenocephalides felis]
MFLYKIAIFLAVVTVAYSSHSIDELDDLDEAFLLCVRELNLNIPSLLLQGNPAENPKLMCFNGCIYRRLGVVQRGKLQVDQVKQFLVHSPDPRVRDVVNKISDECGLEINKGLPKDECTLGGQISKCFRRKMQDLHMEANQIKFK